MKITSKISFFVKEAGRNILDFIFPASCPYCEKQIDSRELFCQKCFNKITFIKGSMCHRCGIPLFCNLDNDKLLCVDCLKKRPVYDMARSVFVYDEFSRESILKFKYADKLEYAYLFVDLMRKAGKNLFKKTDVIMPVPMHWTRKLKRQYNQADILARLIAKKEKLPFTNKVLLRIKYTQTQEEKTFYQRNQNVKNAFKVTNPKEVKGKSILLVDDVLTTGATANNCAKELKKAGAKAVYLLTIAHATKQDL